MVGSAETLATPPLHPVKECSLIMKGGITSGVIYPRLASRLAREYRLCSIGGSSAGAIAAAATAVAELRRVRDGSEDGFERLDALPGTLTEQIAGQSRLLSLFQASAQTRRLFRVLMAVLDAKQAHSGIRVWFNALKALIGAYPVHVLVGALPGLALIVWSSRLGGQALAIGLIGGITLLLICILVGLIYGVRRTVLVDVAANNFGLCSGLGEKPEVPALTEWLHGFLQDAAGQAEPITFGDLQEHDINLKMMTTNLSQGRPMPLPLSEDGFFFDPQVWRRLFPSDLVDWLLAHPSTQVDPELAARASRAGLAPFPNAKDLPIVVAVRMSLSFPFLISAIPLETVDYARSGKPFRTNWFTDGGLCANLPVHFFDRPLPTRPTFAIDLQPTSRTIEYPESGSYLPQRNEDGLSRRLASWTTHDRGGLVAFASAMTDTWQGWVDNEALRLPGYRDRVVTIYTTPGEGGMNLNMGASTVDALAARGEKAADKLVAKFTGPFGASPNTGFDNHRWIRMRSALASLSEWCDQFEQDFSADAQGSTFTYSELLAHGSKGQLPSYSSGNMTAIRNLADDLQRIAQTTNTAGILRGAPHPRARIRLVPDQ